LEVLPCFTFWQILFPHKVQRLSHRNSSKSVKIGLLRPGYKSKLIGGCPIATQQVRNIPVLPKNHSHQGKEPAEAVIPFRQKRQIPQQEINQQGRPHLPAHGIGAGALRKVETVEGQNHIRLDPGQPFVGGPEIGRSLAAEVALVF